MLGQWRLTLRQAEDAVRADRLEEALELARRPEVAEHRQANQLRSRIALQLVERAREHVRQGQCRAAWQDLLHAELAGAPSSKLSPLRGELLSRGVAEVQAALDAGAPAQAIAIVDGLKQRHADSVELRRLDATADGWLRALRSAKVGEFARALDFLEGALRHLGSHRAIQNQIEKFEAARQHAAKIREQLKSALADQDWPAVLQASEHMLDIAPDCHEAKQTRVEALRRLGVRQSGGTIQNAREPRKLDSLSRQRFILWVDHVAGYLVCQGNVVSIGRASPHSSADIAILGDLAQQHATIERDSEGYSIRSARELCVNGQATRQCALRDRDVIGLGSSVQLRFTMPCPVSETARLDLISGHRLQLALAGILLMADTCVLGSAAQVHIGAAKASARVTLYRQGDMLGCRADGLIEVDGELELGRAALQWSSRVIAGDLSFTLEPLGWPMSQV